MPYKDPEKEKANAKERNRRYKARHPGRTSAASRAWYYRNREKVLAKKREQYYADPEKARADVRRRRAAQKEKRQAAGAVAELAERNLEMGLQINRCPRCKSAGAAKVKGSAYLAGCSRQKCEKWVGGDEAVTGTTMEAAIKGWNAWTEEELADQEEAKRLEAEMAAEAGDEDDLVDVGDPGDEGAVDGDSPDEDEDLFDGDDGGDEEAGDDGEADGDGEGDEDAGEGEAAEPDEDAEPEEGDEAAAEGEGGETSARFWLELDGKWYWLAAAEDETDGCAGCAFCFEFGRRRVCVAASSEDFREACELCERLNGVWMEGEATEDGGDEA